MKEILLKRRYLITVGVAIILVIVAACMIASKHRNQQSNQSGGIETTSMLEKIVQVDELSTFSIIYHGVAEGKNNEGEVDYYVSYKASVKTGINTEDIIVSVDHDEQIINIILPDVHITQASVLPESFASTSAAAPV